MMSNSELRIIQVNIDHCRDSALSLQQVVAEDKRIRIVLVQEPYLFALNGQGRTAFAPKDFVAVHCLNAGLDEHGQPDYFGAVMYVHRSLDYTPLSCSHEAAVVKLRGFGEPLFVASVYVRPSCDTSADAIIKRLIDVNCIPPQRLIIGGDVNAYSGLWGSVYEDPRGANLANLILTLPLSCVQFCEQESREWPNRMPDLTLVGNDLHQYLDIPNVFIRPAPELSVHHLLRMMSLKFVSGQSPRLTYRPPAKRESVDLPLLGHFLRANVECFDGLSFSTTAQVDAAVDSLTAGVQDAIRKSRLPRANIGPCKTIWWSRELYALRHFMRKAFKVDCREKSAASRSALETARTNYKRELRRRKAESFREFCSLEVNSDPFNAMRKLDRKPIPTINALVNTAGQTVDEPKEVLEALGDHFFKPLESELSDTQAALSDAVRSYVDSPLTGTVPPLTRDELEAAFVFNKNRACGLDGIPGWLVADYKHILFEPMFRIVGACLQLAHFPSVWKRARVIFINKPGRDPQSPGSYRPISLLPLLSKILERVCRKRFLYDAEKWLSPEQHGFIAGRSTITALDKLTSDVRRGFDCRGTTRSQEDTLACLIDIDGAFDNAWHPAIIHHLIANKCPDYLIKFIYSFLLNRVAVVSVKACESSFTLSKGCPQGSVLSPLLWNVLLDGLLKAIHSFEVPRVPRTRDQKTTLRCIAYADDILVYASHRCPRYLESVIQSAYTQVDYWTRSVRLKLSVRKTELMLFSRKNKQRFVTDLKIQTSEGPVVQVEEVNYLGLRLQRRLKWDTHLQRAKTRTLVAIGNIRRLGRLNWGASTRTLLRLYKAVAVPTLLYGCQVWGQFKHNSRLLDSVQRTMAISALKAFHSVSIPASLVLANWPPLSLQVDTLACKYLAKSLLSSHGNLPSDLADRCSQHIRNCLAKADCSVPTNTTFPLPSIMEPIAPSLWNEQPPWTPKPFSAEAATGSLPALLPTTGTVHVFTDGSKTHTRVGSAAVVCHSSGVVVNFEQRLSDHASSYDAECQAVLLALTKIQEDLSGSLLRDAKAITIFTDCQSVIKAIATRGGGKISQTTRLIQELTLSLSPRFLIAYRWVRGHSNLEGNELADRSARNAGQRQQIDLVTRINLHDLSVLLKQEELRSWNEHWTQLQATNVGYRTRQFIPSIYDAKKLSSLCLDFKAVQILTGHAYLMQNLNRFDPRKYSSPLCQCSLAIEDTDHYLFSCPLWVSQRAIFKDSCVRRCRAWPPPKYLFVADRRLWKALMDFINATNKLIPLDTVTADCSSSLTDTPRRLTPARSRTESFLSDVQPSHLGNLLRRPVAVEELAAVTDQLEPMA